MACNPVTFQNVDERVFKCLRQRLVHHGYKIEGTKGNIHGPMNISIDFEWNAADSTLYTLVVKKNILVSCNRIYNEIDKAIRECEG